MFLLSGQLYNLSLPNKILFETSSLGIRVVSLDSIIVKEPFCLIPFTGGGDAEADAEADAALHAQRPLEICRIWLLV